MTHIKSIVVLLVLGIMSNQVNAQCCAQGTPMGGAGNLGTLPQGSFQFVSFYKYSESTIQKEDNPYNITGADFNFVGTNFAYGITSKLTAELELGYFINKTQHYELPGNKIDIVGFGLSNGIVSMKYQVLKSKKTNWEIVGGIGFKFPFTTEYQVVDNVQLPIDNQTSTCGFGIAPKVLIFKTFPDKDLNLFLIHRTDFNFKNKQEYTYGHGFTTSFFLAKKLNFISCNALGILQVRHDGRTMDIKKDGTPLDITGSNIIFIAPQFGYTFFNNYFLSVAYDFPVYQQFNTEKLKYKHAFTFSLVINFAKKSSADDIKVIEVNDYSIGTKTETIKVYGNCEMCKESIEGTLMKLDGVASANWDIETKMLTVSFDGTILNIDDIKVKIAEIGYDTDTHHATKKAYRKLHSCCQYERP